MILAALSFYLVQSLPPALQSLQLNMKLVDSFTVSFVQTVKQELFPDMTDTAKGSLMFTRPNKMLWTYETPKARKISFDGKELVIEEENQKQKIRDGGRITLERSFSFLWGQPDAELFRVEAVSSSRFLVKPKHPDDVTFKSILVSVEKGRVLEATVIDKLGGESRLQFSNWKTKSR